LVFLLLPHFNIIANKNIHFSISPTDALFAIAIVLLTALIAGAYPAFYLSSLKPATVLKSRKANFELLARRALVIAQFSISIIFIVSFIVITNQMEYTQTINLGYSKDNIVLFKRQGHFKEEEYNVFMTELKRIPGVVNASSLYGSLLDDVGMSTGFSWDGQISNGKGMLFPSPMISHDLIETLGIEVIAGRSFRAGSNDSTNVVINETAAKLMTFKDPIGQPITYGDQIFCVIGVVKDFHYGSLHNSIEPLIFRYSPNRNDIVVKIQAGQEQNLLPELKKVYESFHSDYAFEYSFMDSLYKALYNTETRTAELLKYFTAIAILISCLGLLGLASFVAQQRLKEICIRKVYGSSMINVILLLSNDFTRTIVIAIVVSGPLSYFLANNWLNEFVYRIPFSWMYVVEASLLALLVAWLTIGGLIYRAATINPSRGLKVE
ncbi:MAG: FtsX-like permease family protein, partial [Pseudoxanthomonas sp.]